MKITGKIDRVLYNPSTKMNELVISTSNHIEKSDDLLDFEITKHREKRSLNANALMWVCLSKISAILRADKWDIYLKMLRRYGKYTYICVKPSVVSAVKRQWREVEELGNIKINGQDATQLLCYFGSSTYDTAEFTVLLDGIVSEMVDMGLEPPTSKEMQRSLELWEKQHG